MTDLHPAFRAVLEWWMSPNNDTVVRGIEPAFLDNQGRLDILCDTHALALHMRLAGSHIAQKLNATIPDQPVKSMRICLRHPRILITGSRSWPDLQLLADILMETWHDATQNGHPNIVVVHGGADGADTLARLWAEAHGIPAETHPADWTGPCADTCPPGHRRARRDGTDYCPLAGHRRNQAMVNLGADLCIAFHHNRSTGTADAIRRATAAGIPVRTVTL
jgi:hypothetical protein